MANKKRLFIKWSIGLTITAGIATGIGIPISNAIKHKTKVILWNITGESEILEKIRAFDLNVETKKIEMENGNLVEDTMKPAAFYLYEKEQVASFDAQLRSLRYKIYKEERNKKEIKDKGSSEANKKNIEEIEKKIEKINEKIINLKKHIDNKDKIDYSSSDFKSDFPMILTPIKELKNKELKQYNDKKDVYVKQFTTKAEGLKGWLISLPKTYSGATNDTDAIAQLVYNQIKEKAFLRYKLSLNNSFTLDMKNAKYKDSNDVEQNIYPFLNKVDTTDMDNKADKDKKIYFVGTQSNNKNKIIIDLGVNSKAIAAVTEKNVVEMSHALIKAEPNTKGSSLPWKVSKDTIKKLFLKTSLMTVGQGSRGKWGIELLDENLFNPNKKDQTEVFISHISDNSDGSKTKNGFLGFDNLITQLGSMVPGFTMGIIDGHTGTQVDATTGIQKLKELKEAIVEKMNKLIGGSNPDYKTKTKREINELIDDMNDKEFERKFGGAFQSTFYGANGAKLSWNLGSDLYMLTSKFGLHIVKIKDYRSTDNIKRYIEEDIKLIKDKKDISKGKVNYSKLLKESYSNDAIISELLKDSAFVEKIKAGYEKESTKKSIKDLKTYTKKDAKNNDIDKTWAETKASIEEVIKNNKFANNFEKLNKTLGDKLTSFVLKGLDDKTVRLDLSSSTMTKEIDKIYKKALKLAKLDTTEEGN